MVSEVEKRALEFAARRNVVVIQAAALRASRLAVRLRPAEPLERAVSLFLAALVDFLERKGAGFGREKEVLSHLSS